MSKLIQNSLRAAPTSTDNALVRFDGTSGNLAQNSGVLVDDSNNVTGAATIVLGNVTWNSANFINSTQDLSISSSALDLNFSSGANINFVSASGQVNLVSDGACTFGSVSGSFNLTAGTTIAVESSGDLLVHSTLGNITLQSDSGNLALSAIAGEITTDVTLNLGDTLKVNGNVISLGTTGQGSINHNGSALIINPKVSGSSTVVIGSSSASAGNDANLLCDKLAIGGSDIGATSVINYVKTGTARTALNFALTLSSGGVLAPLVLTAIDASTNAAITFANTISYSINTTSHTGNVSAEGFRIQMGVTGSILLNATNHYIRGITIDCTNGTGGVHVAAAVVRNTGIFQKPMTTYGGAATTVNVGSYWGDDVCLQSGTKLILENSQTNTTTSLVITKGDSYLVYNTGTTAIDTFVNGVNVISSSATLNAIKVTMALSDAVNIQVGTGTGTKIGTSTTQKLGFFNATPVVQPSAYTVSNLTTDRSYDANATTLDEVADVLGTLITDLKSLGLIG